MLTLGISTSAGQFALILGENSQVVFDSGNCTPSNELGDMLTFGLTQCNRCIAELSRIIVDTGPGGTSRVRTGIAFANSLAYSLNVPVSPVSSMALAGIDAYRRYTLPVIHSVKSIKGNAYIGLYNGQDDVNNIQIIYGQVEEIVTPMVAGFQAFVVAGAHREYIAQLPALTGKTIVDSHQSFGNAKILIEESNLFTDKQLNFPELAMPVTEQTV